MIHWFKQLPEANIDLSSYRPFIKNDWFRNHYIYFAYALMLVIFLLSFFSRQLRSVHILIRLAVVFPLFILHELLHILVIFRKGDLYLNQSGIFFWLNPDMKLTKPLFWLFMSLPLLVLTVLPLIVLIFYSGFLSPYILYIAWLNAILSGSDIINSILILIKPGKAVFYRGYYTIPE